MKKLIIFLLLITTFSYGCILFIDCYGVIPDLYQLRCYIKYNSGEFDEEYYRDSFKIFNNTTNNKEDCLHQLIDSSRINFDVCLDINYHDTVENEYLLYLNQNDIDTLKVKYIYTILEDECDATDCDTIIISYNNVFYYGSTCKTMFKLTKE